MKYFKIILLMAIVINLNGCILTTLLVMRSNEKIYIRPTYHPKKDGSQIDAYANKERTKYLFKFQGKRNGKSKNYCLTISKEDILKKLPKDFMINEFDSQKYYQKNLTYKNIHGKNLYRIWKFKKNKIKKIKADHSTIVPMEFEKITPIVLEYTQPKKADELEKDALDRLSKENPVVIHVHKSKKGFYTSPNIYFKINLHQNQQDEYIRSSLIQEKVHVGKLLTLIFIPVTVAADLATSPIQLCLAIWFISSYK